MCDIAEPAVTPADRLPQDYLQRVKAIHEEGGFGSIGYAPIRGCMHTDFTHEGSLAMQITVMMTAVHPCYRQLAIASKSASVQHTIIEHHICFSKN